MKTNYSPLSYLVRLTCIVCLVMFFSSCEPQLQPPGSFYITRCEPSDTGLAIELEWTNSDNAQYYKVYRNGVLHGDNWHINSYYDFPLEQDYNEYYVVAWNESGVYTSAKVSATAKSSGSGGSGGGGGGGTSTSATDSNGHSLASWTQTSSGNYRKSFQATYQVSGNYQAYPSTTYWTGNVTVEYRPASSKYVMYEPYFYPSSNGGLGLCYDKNITWGYNSVTVYTYSYHDYDTHVNYLADCYCRFTIE